MYNFLLLEIMDTDFLLVANVLNIKGKEDICLCTLLKYSVSAVNLNPLCFSNETNWLNPWDTDFST